MYNTLVDWLDTKKTKHYCGTFEKNFKKCYNNHTASFRNKNKGKSIELWKYILELKDSNIQHNLKWRIVSKTHPYVYESRKYDLRLTEKLTIINANLETLLNTRDELVSKCRHMNKLTLKKKKELINNTLIIYFWSASVNLFI